MRLEGETHCKTQDAGQNPALFQETPDRDQSQSHNETGRISIPQNNSAADETDRDERASESWGVNGCEIPDQDSREKDSGSGEKRPKGKSSGKWEHPERSNEQYR